MTPPASRARRTVCRDGARRTLPALTIAAALVLVAAAPADAGPRRPDLRVAVPSTAAVLAGRDATLAVRTSNVGRRRAGSTTVGALLSDDRRADRGDRRLGVRTVGPLAVRGSRTVRIRAAVPRTAAGRHLLLCADLRSQVRETSERDNCAVIAVRGPALPGRPASPDPPGGALPTPGPGAPEVPPAATTAAPPAIPPAAGGTATTQEGPFRIESMSAAFEPLSAEDRAEGIATVERLRDPFCAGRGPASVPSLQEAIASARRFLTAGAGADAMAAFAASPEHDDVRRADRAAAAAVVHGEPGAALVALLRVHELQPDRAGPLADAAALASSLGLPAEGLAFAEGARARRDDGAAPMGVPVAALTDANRGQALALLGRDDDADRALGAARAASPVLQAAAQTQAAVAACRFAGRAGAERAFDLVVESEHPLQGAHATPLPEDEGRPAVLRNFTLPQSPSEAVELEAFYTTTLRQHQNQEIDARNDRERDLEGALAGRSAAWSPAQHARWLGVWAQINRVGDRPSVRARRTAMDEAYDRARQVQWDFWGEPGEAQATGRYQRIVAAATRTCDGAPDFVDCRHREINAQCRPALMGAHDAWLARMKEAHHAATAYVATLSQPMSGLAAQLKDADAHALALLQIEHEEFAVSTTDGGLAIGWTGSARLHREHCVERPADPPPVAAEVGEPADVDSPGACPRLVKPINARLDLGPVTLKINCEEVELSGDVKVSPWIGAFGEIKYDPRAGALTVFVGAQAGGGTGVGTGGDVASASFKSGMYVRVGDDGIRDVGWRTGPGMNVGYGPAEIELKDEIDISFMGAVSSTFGE